MSCFFWIELVSEFDFVELFGDFGNNIDFGFFIGGVFCMCWDLEKFGDFFCFSWDIIVVIFDKKLCKILIGRGI